MSPTPLPTNLHLPACLHGYILEYYVYVQELEERVANVRERGRILTDFLYSMGNAATSPSSARPRRASPAEDVDGRGSAANPTSPARRTRWPLGRPRLSPSRRDSGASRGPGRTGVVEGQPLTPHAHGSELGAAVGQPGEEESQLAAAQRASQEDFSLASEEEKQYAAAIRASLAEGDTSPQGVSHSPVHTISAGGDFPATLPVRESSFESSAPPVAGYV